MSCFFVFSFIALSVILKAATIGICRRAGLLYLLYNHKT